jgi:UDP-N-acetylmuramoyl-tripeptide--D-alanyl-D-alanine ligase
MAINTHPLADILTGIQDPTAAVFIDPDARSGTTIITQVTIDSRLVEPGALYVALVGMTVDGHDYVAAAAAAGAIAAIVSHTKAPELARAYGWSVVSVGAQPPAQWDGLLLIAVPDPLAALQRWATWHRHRYHPPFVVGITGSVGKTSTKEFIGALLDDAMPTLKNPRSYNSESTLPLVVLGLTPTHRAAVFEMGMYYAGDIATLCAIAHPNIAVITAVGPSHLERMGSIEAIAEAKAELVHAIPTTGVVILNADDPIVAGYATRTTARVLTYGTAQHADVRAIEIEQRGLAGTEFRLIAPGIDDRVHLGAPGMHQVRNLLAAIAVGLVAQVPWHTMRDTIAHRLPTVRFVVLDGIEDTQIIDDSYNAAPTSVRAALELLATVQRRRVAVLGDMRELGHIEEAAHREVGTLAAQCVDVLVTVGERGRFIAAGAREAGFAAVYEVQGTEAAVPVVRSVIAPGDCVLVKGSRAMAMEAIVSALCTQTTK